MDGVHLEAMVNLTDWLYNTLTDIYYRLRLMVDCPYKFWIDYNIFFLRTKDDEEPRMWRMQWLDFRR